MLITKLLSLAKVFLGGIVLTEGFASKATVFVGSSIIGIDLDSLVEIPYCPCMIPILIFRKIAIYPENFTYSVIPDL